jgi:hypothetical protein
MVNDINQAHIFSDGIVPYLYAEVLYSTTSSHDYSPLYQNLRHSPNQDFGFGDFIRKNAIMKPMIASESTQGNTPM